MEIKYDYIYKLVNDQMFFTDKALATLLESGFEDSPIDSFYRLLEKFADLLIASGKSLKSRLNHNSACAAG